MAGVVPRLYVHLGLAKTGTTSLQHFLARNAAALKAHVVVHTPAAGSPTQKMGRAAMEFSLDPSPERQAGLVAAIAAVRAGLVATGQDCLISHENLPGAVPGNGATRTLYPMILRILDLLDQGLAPMVPHYVMYLRDMQDWKRSVYGQVVISDRYAQTHDRYQADMADCGTWGELEARIRGHVGANRLSLFWLEDEPDPRFPGQQLLRLAGLAQTDIAALKPISKRNTRMAPAALEFVRQMNQLDLNAPVQLKLVDLVSKHQALFNPAWDGRSDG